MDSDKLTIADAARKWNVSERTVWRWVTTNKIESYKIGGRTFVDAERPVKSRVTVVQPNVTDLTLSGSEQNDIVGGGPPKGILDALESAKKQTFRWQMTAMSAIVTAVMLGSVVFLGWYLYQGQRIAAEQMLSVVQGQVVEQKGRAAAAEDRAETERSRAERIERERAELSREVVELLKEQKSEPYLWEIPLRPVD